MGLPLESAGEHLRAAGATSSPLERALHARIAARRAAAEVLAGGRRARVDGDAVWEVVPDVAPELGEWARYFSDADLCDLGVSRPASPREVDDLLRGSSDFVTLVAGRLEVPPPVAGTLPLAPLRVARGVRVGGRA